MNEKWSLLVSSVVKPKFLGTSRRYPVYCHMQPVYVNMRKHACFARLSQYLNSENLLANLETKLEASEFITL